MNIQQATIQNIESKIIEHEPLARYTSWRIGGPARYFANATNANELHSLLAWARERDLPALLLGGGTNILVADGGYPGLVIRNRSTGWQINEQGDDVTLRVESGAATAGTVRRISAQGIGGLTWAEGLPGTFGGALYGNAGCYGGDMAQHVIRTWVLHNGEVDEWSVDQMAYSYRSSALKRAAKEASDDALPPVILAAELRVSHDDPARLQAQMAEIAAARKAKTPSGSSCGSVFKNPPGTTAGTVLDRSGLKGTRVGNAIVSEKHANYIVNLGGATASDVLRLTDLMRERVLKEMGIELELEIQLVGTMNK